MGLCRMSDESIIKSSVLLDNKFVTDYMAEADEIQLKVYIFGLYQCLNPVIADNTAAHFCNSLAITEEQLLSAFEYWKTTGLVNIVSYDPLEVRYNRVRSVDVSGKLYKPSKYTEFNTQLQDIFPDREVSQGEFLKYYEFLEETRLPQEVLLMIASYCVNYKGYGVRQQYVLAVARSWYDSGVRTVADAEQCIAKQEAVTEAMRLIAKALGKKSAIEIEDRQLYIKWTQSWGFDLEGILFAAKQCKNRGGMMRLDSLLDEFFSHNCLTVTDMKAYTEEKQDMYDLAKDVTRIIGVRYENLETVVSHYVCVWLSQGFDKKAITLIAEYCFENSIRSLNGMNAAINRFYKQGCVTVQSINEYLDQLVERERKIKAVIEATSSSRMVTQSDRDAYALWLDWGFDDEAILYCASLAQGKPQATGYITKLLSRCKDAKAFAVADVKTVLAASPSSEDKNKTPGQLERRYTKEEMGSIFGDLQNYDDIEI